MELVGMKCIFPSVCLTCLKYLTSTVIQIMSFLSWRLTDWTHGKAKSVQVEIFNISSAYHLKMGLKLLFNPMSIR